MKEGNINAWLSLARPLLGTFRDVPWLEMEQATRLQSGAQSSEPHPPGQDGEKTYYIIIPVFYAMSSSTIFYF